MIKTLENKTLREIAEKNDNCSRSRNLSTFESHKFSSKVMTKFFFGKEIQECSLLMLNCFFSIKGFT